MKKLATLLLTTIFCASVNAAIPNSEKKDFDALIKSASDTTLSMTERWQSLIKAGEVAQLEQIPTISKFSKNSDWYMRNAALISLELASFDQALDQAKLLISDKALVVRSAAVETLSKKNTLEIKQLFASELAKTYNYSGTQSLWIRAQLMKQIAKTADSDDRQFLARYLFDSDKQVALISMQTLEKITDLHFSDKNPILQWQEHVKKNNWL